MAKFDLRAIMKKAWTLYKAPRRPQELTFAEALHWAWLSVKSAEINAQRVTEAKAAAGITEETATWSAWREAGYEVIHGSKALFGADLIWGAKGDGAVYKARLFGASQVQPITA